jgi:ABC-type multidrug transport system fused ATPase/permease subunit
MICEMKRLLKHTGGGRRFLCLLALRAPFNLASTLVSAWFLRRAFDAIAAGDAAGLAIAGLGYGVASAGLFLYNGTVWTAYGSFVVRMEGTLRRGLAERIAGFPLERMERTAQGEWFTRLNADVELPFSQPLHLPHAVCAALGLLGSGLMLWSMHRGLLALTLLFVLPHIALSQGLVARAMPGLKTRSLEAMQVNAGDLNAMVTCLDVAALYDGQGYLLDRFEASSKALYRANVRLHLRGALNEGLLPLFGIAGYLVLLMAGGAWIARGQMSFGELTAALQVRGGVLSGARMLGMSLSGVMASYAGIRRVAATMEEEGAETDGE